MQIPHSMPLSLKKLLVKKFFSTSEFLKKYTPYVERLGMDENYLDVTDLVKLKKDNIPSTVAGHVFGDSTQHKSTFIHYMYYIV